MSIQKPQKQKVRNFVAKHTVYSDTIVHKEKQGVRASRERQKREWKKELLQ